MRLPTAEAPIEPTAVAPAAPRSHQGAAPTPQRSLAARLALAYATSAVLLVAAATALQYRALLSSLRAQDDQLLREWSELVGTGSPPAGGGAAESVLTASSSGEITVRWLDAECRTLVQRPRTAPEPLPSPVCGEPPPTSLTFHTTAAANGTAWRVATMGTAAPRSTQAGAPTRVEILLDGSRDRAVLSDFRTDATAILFGSLALAAVLGYGIARRGLRPLGALRARVEGIDARSLGLRLGAPDAPAEVAALTATFDAMLERLQGAFDTLSARSAELAHELRTPIHVLRQQAEVALRRPRTTEEYRDILGSSLEELDRLRRLADDTLFLARAADPRAAIVRELLDVATEFREVIAYLDAVAEEAGIHLSADTPDGLVVAADRTLLRRALVNLVTNALRHTPAGGHVRLWAELAAQGTVTAICVEDDGEGLHPDLLSRAFVPYARGADAHGAPTNSTAPTTEAPWPAGAGLGLSIVRGIMELHGGTATLASDQGQGTRATLRFPVPPCGERGRSASPS